MKLKRKLQFTLVLSVLALFGTLLFYESSAWARAGGGMSSGSRGSRSYSAPSRSSGPTDTSPGSTTPGRNPSMGTPSQPSSGGFFSRSPFMQGLAGGLAGGLIGSLLFGGIGHASPGGMMGGGIGLLEIVLIGLLLFFAWRFFKKRRLAAQSHYSGSETFQEYREPDYSTSTSTSGAYSPQSEVEEGLWRLRQGDPRLSEEALKETFQDIFFRIQAAWMNRSLDGISGMVSGEMADYLAVEFESMKKKGRINRLENIAVRRIETTEIWQEMGKDYVTVLLTANLLDYTVDDKTGEVIGGDKLNPVKFEEFWTFCREIGSSDWKLAAINQPGEASGRVH